MTPFVDYAIAVERQQLRVRIRTSRNLHHPLTLTRSRCSGMHRHCDSETGNTYPSAYWAMWNLLRLPSRLPVHLGCFLLCLRFDSKRFLDRRVKSCGRRTRPERKPRRACPRSETMAAPHLVRILSRPLPENKPLQNERHGLQTAMARAVQ